jgi:hypothetical protein
MRNKAGYLAIIMILLSINLVSAGILSDKKVILVKQIDNGASGENPFDQDLNTTNNVEFNEISLNRTMSVSIYDYGHLRLHDPSTNNNP